MKTKLFQLPLYLCVATFLSSLSGASAASIVNDDSGGNLVLGASWFGGNPPGTNDIGVFDFNITPSGATNLFGGVASWAGIQVLNPATTVSIGAGSTLTNGANGIDMTHATQGLTLSNALSLATVQSFLVTNGQTLVIAGPISQFTTNTGPLILNGGPGTNGTIVIYSANTYSNGTLLNGGAVVVSNSAAFGTGTLTNAGGTTMVLSQAAGITLSAPEYYFGTNFIDMNSNNLANGSDTLSLPLSGNGTIIISNLQGVVTNDSSPVQTLTFGASASGQVMSGFSGHITFAGVTSTGTAAGGDVRFNSGSTVNTGSTNMSIDMGSGTVTLTLRNGGTVNIGELKGGPYCTLLGSRSTSPSLDVWSIGGLGTSTTYSGVIRDSTIAANEQAGLTKVGTGTLTLTGNTNTYSGGTPVLQGTLQIGDGTADGSIGSGTVSISAGASVVFNRPDVYTITNLYNGAGYLVVSNSGTFTLGAGTNGAIACPIDVISPATLDVSANTFTLKAALYGNGTVNVGGPLLATNGSALYPGNPNLSGTLTINGGLTENGSINNQYSLSSPGGTNDLVAVNGNINLSGLNFITLTGFGTNPVAVGTYPLITYTGTLTGGTNNFLVLAVGLNASLMNNTALSPPQIDVIIAPPTRSLTNLTWIGDGINNFWDNNTLNWTNLNGTGLFTFISGDTTYFTDLATNNLNTTVNVQSFQLPSAIIVSNTVNHYTFTGPGSIVGPFGITKTNSGVLTIVNTNFYSGQTIIGGGVLEITNIANSGNQSPIGEAGNNSTNIVFYGGAALRYSGTDASPSTDHGMTTVTGGTLDITNAGTTLTSSGLITGSGSLAKAGKGTLLITGANSYSGGTTVSNGILYLGTSTAINNGAGLTGAGTTNSTITFDGGTLELFGFATNTSPGNLATYALLNNPLSVPAGQTGTLELPPRGTTATGAGAGLNGPLTGSGTLNLVVDYVRYPLSGNWSAFTGTINVTGSGATNLNVNTANAVSADIDEFRLNNTFGYSNAIINLIGDPAGAGNTPPSTLVMAGTAGANTTYVIGELDGTTNAVIGNGTGSEGNTTYSVGWKNTSSTFAGIINDDTENANPPGRDSIVKNGTGTWTLSGQNNYSGSTIVSNGTLALITTVYGDASIANSTNYYINTGATLDFHALTANVGDPQLQISGGQTLGGGGSFLGNVLANNHSTIIPGNSLTSAGALKINGTLNEAGGVLNEFALATAGTSNGVINAGNLNLSGGVQLISLTGLGTNNTIGPVGTGTYTLFNITNMYNGDLTANSFIIVPGSQYPFVATLGGNLSSTPKTIAVTITAPPPTNGLVWVGDGANDYWNVFDTADWVIPPATSATFESGDTVFFGDQGIINNINTMNGQNSIALAFTEASSQYPSSLYPSSIVFSNTMGVYQLNGPGTILGTTSIIKTNGGEVIVSENNLNTGPTILGGGIYSIGFITNGGFASPLGISGNNASNLVFYGGVLAYTGNNASTDRGMLVTNGGGTISVVDNGNSGTILTDTSAAIIGNGNTLIVSNTIDATFAPTGANTNNLNWVVNGGILSVDLAENSQAPVVGSLGNPQLASKSVTVNTNGILSLDSAGGNPFGGGSTVVAMSFIVNQGGLMRITNGNATIGPLTLNGGWLYASPSAGVSQQYGSFELGGTVTVGGAAPSLISSDNTNNENLTVNSTANRTFVVNQTGGGTNTDLSVTAILGDASNGGTAGLVKMGAGIMTLFATNTYGGPTIISNGVMNIAGSIGPGTNFLSYVSIFGGSLGGDGTVYSPITNYDTGTLAPGAAITNTAVTLTVSNSLTLLPGSVTKMNVVHTGINAFQNDSIVNEGGVTTYGGELLINTNGDTMPYQAGETIQLFSVSGTGSFNAASFFNSVQPQPGPGLVWNTNNLAVNGSISVAAATPVTVASSFIGGPTNGPAPLTVTFTNNSTGGTYWVWNFGDGSLPLPDSTGGNITYTYSNANFSGYTVTMTTYGPGGQSAKTNLNYIVVTNSAPVALYTNTAATGSTTLAVTFTNITAGGLATNFLYSFGDGTSTDVTNYANVSHSYTNSGTWGVGLTVTGTGGTSFITNANYITTTNPIPSITFTANKTSGSAPLAVTFTNGAAFQTNSIWFYGNGISNTVANAYTSNSIPTSANVSETYTNAGSYSVTLVAMGIDGTNFLFKSAYITVTNPAPTPLFAASPTNGSVPLAVTFTNLSTYETNSIWIFGDGTLNVTNTTGANIPHTYSSVGTNTVTLIVMGTGGSNQLYLTNYIVVTNGVSLTPPVALFAGIPTNLFALQSVLFTNTSTGGITNSAWTFGDGNTINVGGANATNSVSDIYTNAGSYSVILTVTSPGGTNSLTNTAYIVVYPKPVIASAAITGGNLILSGTNGVPNAEYRILTSLAVTNALATWTPVSTNTFSAAGSYSYTNSAPTNVASFFILVSP